MKIAVLYQAISEREITDIKKPMKKGGYSDSGADIAFTLIKNGYKVITPVDNPDEYKDYDFVFPDTENGIMDAINRGANTFFLNTILFSNHPITKFYGKGYHFIGNLPEDVDKYDNKFYINNLLKDDFDVIEDFFIDVNVEYDGEYPCVVKPIMGRGSQGVSVVNNYDELRDAVTSLIESKKYGSKLMVEEYLDGREITITIMPNGKALKPVFRFNHIDGICPYNGDVPVVDNSKVIDPDESMKKIILQCEEIYKQLDLKGMIRL